MPVRHTTHVVRVALLFLAGMTVFLIARRAFVPPDFGTLGFYRAGTLDDVKAHKIAYAGAKACDECHAGTYDGEVAGPSAKNQAAPLPAAFDPRKDNKHSVLRCESCHGPLAFHIDEPKAVAKVGADKLCLGCHRQITGRPSTQPQVVPGDHGGTDSCISCHRPHRPRTDEDKG
jgi:predicted CXXCH cytochrome family protein